MTKKVKPITHALLTSNGACLLAVDWFRGAYPRGIVPTKKNLGDLVKVLLELNQNRGYGWLNTALSLRRLYSKFGLTQTQANELKEYAYRIFIRRNRDASRIAKKFEAAVWSSG